MQSMVCLRKMFNGERVLHLKRYWNICVIISESLIKIAVKVRAEKMGARFYHPPNILLRGTKYCASKRLCSSTLKRSKLKIYISHKENKLTCLTNS